jgi:hypothetical protein
MSEHRNGDSGRTWVWCSDCGHRSGLEFHNPNKIHCTECGRVVGESEEDVGSEFAALRTYYQVVVDTESGECLSGVEWEVDKVEVHDG